jgi:predicted alpha/beta-fold hydrolase
MTKEAREEADKRIVDKYHGYADGIDHYKIVRIVNLLDYIHG